MQIKPNRPRADLFKQLTCQTRLMLLVVAMALVVGVGGCATQYTDAVMRQPASSGQSLLTVYRPSLMANALVNPSLVINGQSVERIPNGYYLQRELAPGEYWLGLDLPARYTGKRRIRVLLEAGKSVYIRLSSELQFQQHKPYIRRFHFDRVDSELALVELSAVRSLHGRRAGAESRPQAEPGGGESAGDGFGINKTRNPFAH